MTVDRERFPQEAESEEMNVKGCDRRIHNEY